MVGSEAVKLFGRKPRTEDREKAEVKELWADNERRLSRLRAEASVITLHLSKQKRAQ